MNPFHLAIPVSDLKLCRQFYKEVLGCEEGRSDAKWVDFNFFGHQLVIHQKPENSAIERQISNSVDSHNVPVPHFGVVLEWDVWEELSQKLKAKRSNL